MRLGLLHLSDIHMTLGDNSVISKYPNIIPAIQEYLFEVDAVYVIISGDSAYSGNEGEYEKVINMLKHIENQIVELKKFKPRFVVIPGNHDCDFKDTSLYAVRFAALC
ncbi:metallophosphoesterase family protein [Paenibacillus allorhizosphaerae]|uniref:3',5'-cyclic adenosine monophosphate phosphodiesterase CpdA n=1 Tax=Paenibacillus allorhizosphaerae TaxID=2849866 RepID=A0ABM8VQK9_9BACL|nr:metallophosphoesterase [Paenibacillus allorhizosphaerae]CAG7654316.1 3',5'-cyclic adenosine monophosphate phosphodiesterase CpdA [Paenibacillus allorhizosphaerae]